MTTVHRTPSTASVSKMPRLTNSGQHAGPPGCWSIRRKDGAPGLNFTIRGRAIAHRSQERTKLADIVLTRSLNEKCRLSDARFGAAGVLGPIGWEKRAVGRRKDHRKHPGALSRQVGRNGRPYFEPASRSSCVDGAATSVLDCLCKQGGGLHRCPLSTKAGATSARRCGPASSRQTG